MNLSDRRWGDQVSVPVHLLVSTAASLRGNIDSDITAQQSRPGQIPYLPEEG